MTSSLKCRKCNMKLEDRGRLEIHEEVPGRKSRNSEYVVPEFNKDRLRG